MTSLDLSALIPLKWKTAAAALGGILTLVAPWIIQTTTDLPQPWPLLIGGVFFVLGLFGVYHAPYVPPGGAIVSKGVAETVQRSLPPVPGQYVNPWKPSQMRRK